MLVIAHRGANQYAPQNTIEAFKKATELNVDGVETDIRITSDGHMVLCHNSKINKTSDGKGKISDMSLNELMNFDFGSWFGERFRATKIPTLEEFLSLMKDSDLPLLDIELKPLSSDDLPFVEQFLEMVKTYGLSHKLFVTSFDTGILRKVKMVDPSIRTGYLYPKFGECVRSKIVSPVEIAIKNGIDVLLPQRAYVSKAITKKAHNAGLKVGVWTVNKIDYVRDLVNMGIDIIITDFPELIRNKVESL